MAAKKKNIQELLAVGLSAVFHPEPLRKEGQRYQAWIRGWQENHYLFLEIKMDTERNLVFRERGRCIVRFLKDGLACAFEGQMVDWQVSKQNPFFRISWPHSVNYLSIRKHQRIEVDVPCSLFDERGVEHSGTVRDLSAAGVGVIVSEPLETGTKLRVTFSLPDGSCLSKASIIVRSVRQTTSGHFLGCELASAEEEARETLDFYISTTVARLRQEETVGASIVIIDPDEENIEASRKMLERLGYQVSLAENLVDGFFRLRLMRPHALVMNANLGGDISGCAAAGIVRKVKGFEALPLFIYGAGASEQQALQAGATAYFSDLSDRSGFPQALAEHVVGDSSEEEGEEPNEASSEHASEA